MEEPKEIVWVDWDDRIEIQLEPAPGYEEDDYHLFYDER